MAGAARDDDVDVGQRDEDSLAVRQAAWTQFWDRVIAAARARVAAEQAAAERPRRTRQGRQQGSAGGRIRRRGGA